MASAIEEVNRALAARERIELVAADDGVLLGHSHVGDAIDDVLARIAEPIVREIGSGHDGGSGSAPTTPVAGSSTTSPAPGSAAGATWRRAATGRRPAAIGRGRRRSPGSASPGRSASMRPRTGRTSRSES